MLGARLALWDFRVPVDFVGALADIFVLREIRDL
jgi:hypothetical protein